MIMNNESDFNEKFISGVNFKKELEFLIIDNESILSDLEFNEYNDLSFNLSLRKFKGSIIEFSYHLISNCINSGLNSKYTDFKRVLTLNNYVSKMLKFNDNETTQYNYIVFFKTFNKLLSLYVRMTNNKEVTSTNCHSYKALYFLKLDYKELDLNERF